MFYKQQYNFHRSKTNIARCFSLLLAVLAPSLYVMSQNEYPLVKTGLNVTPNYTLPKNVLKPDEPLTISFSIEPKDEEIFRSHLFEEPLVPMEGKYSAKENTVLVFALAAFSQRKKPEDFSVLLKFLNDNPNSRWRGALLTNLALMYRRSGYYNKALDTWLKAWQEMKAEKNNKAKLLADRVVAELLSIYCWVGRQTDIDSLFQEINNREISGSAGERIISARSALYIMKSRPGVAFKCGPYALNKLFTLKDSSKPFSKKLMDVKSTSKGFSLFELQQLANETGLKYQMAFRNPGAPIIEKAVVHWKLDHYSALIKNDHGFFKCEDPTAGTFYGERFWLTSEALDSSASGYFLVPQGALPSGWRRVSNTEGKTVFGKGVAPPDPNPWPPTPPPCDNGCSDDDKCSKGMAQASIYLASINLHIDDTPFYYEVPKGPKVSFSLSYNRRSAFYPTFSTQSNLGWFWTCNWFSYIADGYSPDADVTNFMGGGGFRRFTSFDSATNMYSPELYTKDILERLSGSCYVIHHPNGSKEVYGRVETFYGGYRRIYLTQIVDVEGNSITLSYDDLLRLVAVQDALGQITILKYEYPDPYVITEVTSLGKSAKIGYEESISGSGLLNKITDMGGMISSFKNAYVGFYDGLGYYGGVTSMTTPYGTTTFDDAMGFDNYYAVQINHPLGAKERAEFKEEVPGIPFSESVTPSGMNLFNSFLAYRNTFYWDKKQMLDGAGDYTKATIYHWQHGTAGTEEDGFTAPLLESMKKPLENRVWYNYQGQSVAAFTNLGMSAKPSLIGQVLSDGTTQLKQFYYNKLDKDSLTIDPSGRLTTFKYDSTGIDLLEIKQSTELIAKFTYDPQHPHLVKTATDASGLATTYAYNNSGQITNITNAKKEKTTLSYDSKGYLRKVTGSLAGSTTSFSYDGYGRVRTITDAEGYTITKDYDKLDRPTAVTYPDGTYDQIVYNRLDAVATKDRRNRWTHYLYDSLRRLNAVIDPLGRTTQYIWCACGNLSEIVDPLKHVTAFNYDVQSRLTSKTYDDGKFITYKYDNASDRLIEKTDSKGQTTRYSYYTDDNLKQIDYLNAKIATPSVYFAYDDIYNRLDSMTDGTGATAYKYYPVRRNPALGAGKLQTVNGPLQNDDIVYKYDSLGRIKSRSINGVDASFVYDALGRVTSATNALGTFKYSYVNTTNRIEKITNPNNTNTVFTYFDNLGDQRLKEIWNRTAGTTFSKFDYEYDDEGHITKWTQKTDGASKYYDLGYDLADQLTSATLKAQNTERIVNRYAYQYDIAGNRTDEQVDNSVTSAPYNTLNQITAQDNGGLMRFAGKVNEFSSVVVDNTTTNKSSTATIDSATNNFEAFVKVAAGQNNIKITATDYSGNFNAKANNYNVRVSNGKNNSLQYDNNGNTISQTNPAVAYDYDAEDRLVKITQNDSVTTFIYDGLGRRVAEKLNGAIIKRWLWCGTELCEERNKQGGTVTKRFFPQGEQINGRDYYFTKDHLGSIRELTNSAGNLVTRYDYNPYGRRTKTLGTTDADFGFTGHYYHASTGLHLALYRAYDASLGRWLNRDPVGESEGINLYKYANNSPIRYIDFYGNTAWGYDQNTGTWSIYPSSGIGPPAPKGNGYSGAPGAVNDPSKQNRSFVGPIPQGEWTAGEPVNNKKSTGPQSVPLTPQLTTDTFGRDQFYIHGDNGLNNQSASEGCIILPPDLRSKIKNGDTVTVTP